MLSGCTRLKMYRISSFTAKSFYIILGGYMKKTRLLQTAAYAFFATTFLFGAGGKSVKNGTYTAAVGGMNGDVEVSVTIKGKKITNVEVTKEAETPGIGTRLKDIDGKVVTAGGLSPVDIIPQRIVENQSVNVDIVTGATITSGAITAAVSKCLQQAGANMTDWSKKQKPAKAPSNARADVVVVGGGGAATGSCNRSRSKRQIGHHR